MKKYLLSITSLLFSALLIAQPSVTVLGEKVTITFPGSARITSNEGGIKVFEYSKDSIILYAAMSMDLSLMGLQAETIKNMGELAYINGKVCSIIIEWISQIEGTKVQGTKDILTEMRQDDFTIREE